MKINKNEILKLNDGECYTVPESDYGAAEVWKINERYFLFEIPLYGGIPRYEKSFKLKEIDEMIKIINSWT